MSAVNYLAAWRQVSARIRGLERAATIHAGFLAVKSDSPYGADKALQKHCEGIRDSVVQFQQVFGGALPTAASSAIDRFLAGGGQQIAGNTAGDALLVRSIIVKLVAFEAELTFCLDDSLERVRSASELAFMHLQRLIVADSDYRKKWKDAFDHHETHCEALGGVHLLWHGIWAFKADAKGGKTDLVYQEPLRTDATPLALGMVLTEWKRSGSNTAPAYEEARKQAAQYSSGVLAGVELISPRFLVIVTEYQCQQMADVTENGVVYRHINIAVDPQVPSVTARRLAD